ncbi:hydroxyacid-oxoacid transhydrogenase [Deinococcus sonorensis]
MDAGWELQRLGVRRALVVTDPRVAVLDTTRRVLQVIEAAGIETVLFDGVRVEPTLASLEAAVQAARDAQVDGYVAIGGGSCIDTAKVANLVVSDGGQIMQYVNLPIGEGRRPGAPLRPLLALPTTSGSGSEATTVAILDLPDLGVKTGISHRSLRPSQAIVDPELAATAPAAVTAAAGLDVVCHAAESFLSRPYTSRPRPERPEDRPPYQGRNPVSDLWSAAAIEAGGRYLRRAVYDPADVEARGRMMLSATMAGVGFGSAGVHIPHACAYPVAGLRHTYRAPGYPADHPFVPHGFSVIVTAPAAFRFTYDADPERHEEAARLLGGAGEAQGRDALPAALTQLMRDVGAPSGLRELGYDRSDLPQLVEGALKQTRLLAVAPVQPSPDDLQRILAESLELW